MATPTDFRGATMVQPDGSHKNTPIPDRFRKRVGKKAKKRAGGNYKRHWSQVRARTSKRTARKKG